MVLALIDIVLVLMVGTTVGWFLMWFDFAFRLNNDLSVIVVLSVGFTDAYCGSPLCYLISICFSCVWLACLLVAFLVGGFLICLFVYCI